MTCRALKVIDNVGGIDNYLLSLDNAEAAQSNYVTKMRELVASTLYHRGTYVCRPTRHFIVMSCNHFLHSPLLGLLGATYIKKLRYDAYPPEPLPPLPSPAHALSEEAQHLK